MIKSEIFEEYINEGRFEIDDSGPLHSPIDDLSIERDKKLNIILETISKLNSTSGSVKHSPGTVRINNYSIELTSFSGASVLMDGILSHGITTTYGANMEPIRKECSLVNSIEATIGDISTGQYLIEWLENVDDGYYSWPDSVGINSNQKTLISIGEEPNKIEVSESTSSMSVGKHCVYLSIGNNRLYLVSSQSDENSVGVKSGYILYLGIPSGEERKKIRNCLSFTLGRPLVELGYSTFNSEWDLVSFKSISAYSFGGTAFSLRSSPPSPLSEKYQNCIDSVVINNLVNSIYQKYDDYKFGHLAWSYWHAIYAPAHIAGVHFGACIESLLESYIKNNDMNTSRALIDKPKWKIFAEGVFEVLESLNLSETQNDAIKSKFSSLNQAPQNILIGRFFKNLDMNFSKSEESAWQQRDYAAHGKEIEKGGEVKLIRNLKILKMIFHRALLKIAGGTVYYTDYYSEGLPTKSIFNSIDENA